MAMPLTRMTAASQAHMPPLLPLGSRGARGVTGPLELEERKKNRGRKSCR